LRPCKRGSIGIRIVCVMRVCRQTVEHPFGTISRGWGDALPDEIAQDVSTEMALHVLVYNMKRAGILGVASLIEAIRA